MTIETPTPPEEVEPFDNLLGPLRWTVGLLALMLFAVTVGGAILIGSLAANDRAILAARSQARLTTCRTANRTRDEAINAAKLKAADLIAASRAANPHAPTATEQATWRAFIVSQGVAAAKAYPLLDCTDAGIVAYYTHPPKAVDEGCVPDHKGYCAEPATKP